MAGNLNRKITVHFSLGKEREPISKIIIAKRVGGMAQMVQCLPSNHEVLSSNPVSSKKKKEIGIKSQGLGDRVQWQNTWSACKALGSISNTVKIIIIFFNF
jgi:hypothetical protein